MSGSIVNPGDYQSAQDWLDALSSKECDENEFVRAAQERIRKNPDTGWDLLSFLDQYYRRGKITTEVFRNVKLILERALVGGANSEDSGSVAQRVLYTRLPCRHCDHASRQSRRPLSASNIRPRRAARPRLGELRHEIAVVTCCWPISD